MANLLRYQGFTRPFVSGLEPLTEEDDMASAERYGMPAPQNASGILERNVAPPQQTPGEYQLTPPSDLRLPQRDDTPHLGSLTLPNAQPPRFGGGEQRRLSMVEGLPDVGPPPQAPGKPQQPMSRVDPMDAYDRAEAARMQRQRRGIGIAGIVSALFGDSRTQDQRAQALQAASQSIDPNAPMQRMQERHAAAAQAAQEAEQRDYERGMMDRRLGLEERRIAQAEGATSQDVDRAAAMYDPEHPAAQSARIAYARLYRAIPPGALAQLSAFQPDQSMRGMSAMDIRQQAQALTQAWGRLQQANPNLFRVGRRSAGGRTARGGLAGLSGQRRTVDYGVSEGLTPEDYQALGIDPAQFGMETPAEEMASEGVAQPPAGTPPPGPPSQSRAPAPAGGGGMGMGGGMRPQAQPRTAAPAQATQAAPAAQGRALIDRPMTDEELSTASPQVRATQLLAEAQMRRWATSDPAQWRRAVAAVETMGETERDRLLVEFGNPNATRVPGWRRVRDVPGFTSAQAEDMREAVTQANQVRANVRRIRELAQRAQALDLADDQLRGNPIVSEWRTLARRIQTALRMIDRTGVPTGNEQQRAMEEAPEPDSVQALMRAMNAYSTLPDALDRQVWQYMDARGYRPEPRRQGGQ